MRFCTDTSPDAYETVVDRLLASPRYGEHMAVRWLDAARYADTSGYQNDGPRSMWRWRDWVINAFNSNQPFDQFTIEQLAGDLLETPSLDQRIATGFNRNHRGNAEGGIIPEEYQVEYVVDRVDTTFTVWLGLTMGCARCHDHKYDPIRQKEFYQVFAYFNNIPESGRAIKEGNSPPLIQGAAARGTSADLIELDREIDAAESRRKDLQDELEAAQRDWEAGFSPAEPVDWFVADGLVNHLAFDGNLTDSVRKTDAAFDGNSAGYAAGRRGQAIELRWCVDRECRRHRPTLDTSTSFPSPPGYMRAGDNGTLISRMTPVEEGAGYYIHLQDGRRSGEPYQALAGRCDPRGKSGTLPRDRWCHLAVTYDGSRLADGIASLRRWSAVSDGRET